MAGMTSYLQAALLNHLLNLTPYVAPTNLYVSLHTVAPTDAGSHANEVPTGASGYARIPITGQMSAADPVSGLSLNTALIASGVALTDWGLIVAIAIEDALTGGNMLMWALPSAPEVISAGQKFTLLAANISMRFD